MAASKPDNVWVPGWIERQIRSAQANGAFDDLPGQGKPIADLDRPRAEMAWVANYLKRENVDAASLLPPALALAKEVETLPELLRTLRSESEARRLIDDLNTRIKQAHARPADGPPVRVKLVKVEVTIDAWRQGRAEVPLPPRAPEPPERPASTERPSPRRGPGWLRRR
jgi:hypothetical protein